MGGRDPPEHVVRRASKWPAGLPVPRTWRRAMRSPDHQRGPAIVDAPQRYALGAGFDLTVMCDIRARSERAAVYCSD